MLQQIIPTVRSGEHLFSIPELVASVCSYLDRKQLPRLLRVSRLLFECVCPFVWAEVNDIGCILRVLLGPQTEHIVEGYVSQFDISPDLLGSLDTSRFNLYAALIRRIAPDQRRDVRSYWLEGDWSSFLTHYETTTLLPNLQHLDIYLTSVRIAAQSKWLAMFFSSSLRHVRLRIDKSRRIKRSYVPLSLELLPPLITRCPNLDTLKMEFPHNFHPTGDDDPDPESDERSELTLSDVIASACNHLGCLQRLQTLHIRGPFALHPDVLQTLGMFPMLHSLTLCDHSSNLDHDLSYTLSPQAFPALQELSLAAIENPPAMVLLCNLEPLIHGLTRLTITDDRHFTEVPDSVIVLDCLQNLKRHNNNLSCLSLSLGPNEQMLTDSLIAELAELSLSRFELWLLSAYFISKPVLSKLTIGLGPNLSELAIPRTQISYEGLCIVAANLLNLRILELGSVYYWVERPQTGEHKHTTQPMHLKCKYWALDHATSTQVMMVARYV
ncbi:hypothetical protein FRC12_004462 [Ceratobasidium sp. 428]|nr:hypothetical protein FRC12_004462 [Ceratobasidium sp. 428]